MFWLVGRFGRLGIPFLFFPFILYFSLLFFFYERLSFFFIKTFYRHDEHVHLVFIPHYFTSCSYIVNKHMFKTVMIYGDECIISCREHGTLWALMFSFLDVHCLHICFKFTLLLSFLIEFLSCLESEAFLHVYSWNHLFFF